MPSRVIAGRLAWVSLGVSLLACRRPTKETEKIGIKQHPYEISHCIPSFANIHEEIAFQDIARYHFGSSLYSFPWLKSFKTKECWHEELFINPPLACLPYHEILAWQTRQHDVSPSFMLNAKNQNQQASFQLLPTHDAPACLFKWPPSCTVQWQFLCCRSSTLVAL